MAQQVEQRSHVAIERRLRRDILSGRYTPGSRLPRRIDLEAEFRVSMPTIQRAFDALVAEGFLIARPGAGTFVSPNPPHLHHFALLHPSRDFKSRFYASLTSAASAELQGEPTRILEYFHRDQAQFARVCDDVATGRIAGLIVVHPQFDIWNSPAMRDGDLPRVVIAGEHRPGIPTIDIDTPAFYRRAVEHLIARGRRKLALVIPESGHNLDQIFLAELRRHGLSAKPYWVCNVARDSGPRSVSDALRLLLELDGEKRPDGLILGDDNTVEAAAAGMMSSSLRVGQDFDVVAHCNFPDPVGANFAFARLGYDCRQMIRLALERLDARRRGEKADGLTLIEPVFEWERRSAPRTD